jgi:hypothetical protein
MDAETLIGVLLSTTKTMPSTVGARVGAPIPDKP